MRACQQSYNSHICSVRIHHYCLPTVDRASIRRRRQSAGGDGRTCRCAPLVCSQPRCFLPLLGVSAQEKSFAGEPGGPFASRSLSLSLHASSGKVAWRLDGLPPWLRANAKRGTTTQSGTVVKLSLRNSVEKLRRSEAATLIFTNLTAPDQAPAKVRIRIAVEP